MSEMDEPGAVVEEAPDQPVRHDRPTKKRKLAHDDGSNISEHGDDLRSAATSTPHTQKMSSGNEHGTGSQIRDSLPSPPLSVEVPFVGVISLLATNREESTSSEYFVLFGRRSDYASSKI